MPNDLGDYAAAIIDQPTASTDLGDYAAAITSKSAGPDLGDYAAAIPQSTTPETEKAVQQTQAISIGQIAKNAAAAAYNVGKGIVKQTFTPQGIAGLVSPIPSAIESFKTSVADIQRGPQMGRGGPLVDAEKIAQQAPFSQQAFEAALPTVADMTMLAVGARGLKEAPKPGEVTTNAGDISHAAVASSKTVLPSEPTPSIKSAGAAANILGDLANGEPLGVEALGPLNVEARRVVMSHVLGIARKDPQIADTIIGSIPVDVMDYFVGKEWAANSSLDNVSMLVDKLSVNPQAPVPAGLAAGIFKGVSTLQGAEISNPNVARFFGELSSASRALSESGPPIGGASAPTASESVPSGDTSTVAKGGKFSTATQEIVNNQKEGDYVQQQGQINQEQPTNVETLQQSNAAPNEQGGANARSDINTAQEGQRRGVQEQVSAGEATPPASEAESGISNERLQQIYGEDAVIAGKGRGPKEWQRIGQADTRDPYAVLSSARAQGIAAPKDVALLRAEHQRLLETARQSYGTPRYGELAKNAADFANATKQVAHGPASDVFRALQEADVPRYDSPADFDSILRERMNREATPEETQTFTRVAEQVKNGDREAVSAATEAQTRLRRSRLKAAKMKEPMKFEDAADYIRRQLADLTKDCL